MEVGRDKTAPGGVFRVTPQNIPLAADAPNDFPVTMNVSTKHDMLYMISKMGYLFLFDILSGKAIYRARITTDTVFCSCEHTATGGILCITRGGQVLRVGIRESNLVPYIVEQLRDNDLAFALSSRLNSPGADTVPVAFGEVVNSVAAPLSIPGHCVKFSSCSMSDKFICVCENVAGTQQIAIVDLQAGNSVTRQKISAEAAIMNPVSKIIALKAGQTLQIFNLELRAKMKTHAMPAAVQFWRWISPNAIALVTATEVRALLKLKFCKY